MDGVPFKIGGKTKYILSTSGRTSSLKRYARFLQDILDVDVAYLPIHSGDDSPVDPERFTQALRGLPCLGGAISKDIKHSVIPFLDHVDDLAMQVQSVNTVVVGRNRELYGYNTDVLGFRQAIESGVQRADRPVTRAVCYGYGGVAYVVVSVLQSLGMTVSLCGRSLEKAEERAQELGVKVWCPSDEVDLFVNATPASEQPLDQAPHFLDALQSARVVFDHEMPGRYLREYCTQGDRVYIPGTDMYYPQMAKQWALFLGSVAPELAADPERLIVLLREAEK